MLPLFLASLTNCVVVALVILLIASILATLTLSIAADFSSLVDLLFALIVSI